MALALFLNSCSKMERIYFFSFLQPCTQWGRAQWVTKWPQMHCRRERQGGQRVYKLQVSLKWLRIDQALNCDRKCQHRHKVIIIMKTPHVRAKLCPAVCAVLFYGPSPEHNEAEARAGGHPAPWEARYRQGHPNVCLVELLFHHCSPPYQLWHVPEQALPPSFHWHLLKQHSPRSDLDVSFGLPVTFHFQGDVMRNLQVLISQLFKDKDFKA